LGFMHPSPNQWLEILITCNLSFEIVSMIRQDSVVARLSDISHYCIGGMAQ
jgi:hypothetical protein